MTNIEHLTSSRSSPQFFNLNSKHNKTNLRKNEKEKEKEKKEKGRKSAFGIDRGILKQKPIARMERNER